MEPRYESVHFTEREQSLTGFNAYIETGQIPDAILAAQSIAARYREEAARKLSRADEIEALANELANYMPEISDEQISSFFAVEDSAEQEK